MKKRFVAGLLFSSFFLLGAVQKFGVGIDLQGNGIQNAGAIAGATTGAFSGSGAIGGALVGNRTLALYNDSAVSDSIQFSDTNATPKSAWVHGISTGGAFDGLGWYAITPAILAMKLTSAGALTLTGGITATAFNGRAITDNAGFGPTWSTKPLPYMDTNGVTETGKYLDFHGTTDDGVDYQNRLISSSGGITFGSSVSVTVNADSFATGNEAFTYDEGTYQATSASNTGSATMPVVSFVRTGKMVTLNINTTSTGTGMSNANFVFGTLDTSLRPARATVAIADVNNNGSHATSYIQIDTNGNIEVVPPSGTWQSTSGGVWAGTSISYCLN